MTGERVVIEIAVLRIERDAIGCDLRWRFLLLLEQRFAVHNKFDIFFRLSGCMAIEKSTRFDTLKIDNDDGAFGRLRDERGVAARVDANIIEVTFLRRHIFTERNCLHDLVGREIDLHQLGPAFDDFLHFWRCGIEDPQIVLIIDYHALHADKMRIGRTRFIPFVIGKCFRLAIHDLSH